MKRFTHGLVAVNEQKEVLHFVGYWNQPTDLDVKHIDEELRTDEELGLVGKQFTVEQAAPTVVIHYNQYVDTKE